MKAKKSLIAVIGNGGSGKSTIIQSLTGCKSASFQGRMEDGKTEEWIEVIAHSPQETGLSKAELERTMKTVARDPRCLGIVIALQPTRPYTRLWIEDVLKMSTVYRISSHCFAIVTPYDETRADGVELSNVKTRCIGVPIHAIDARRFAYLNARRIRRAVGWFGRSV